MSGKYDDIINLPHHVSTRHAQMPIADRAAQFSPFKAMVGHDAAVNETARLTDSKAELSEDVKAFLNEQLNLIQQHIDELPEVAITYFVADAKKTGGAYIATTGTVKKFDDVEHTVIMRNGAIIPIDDIFQIEITS